MRSAYVGRPNCMTPLSRLESQTFCINNLNKKYCCQVSTWSCSEVLTEGNHYWLRWEEFALWRKTKTFRLDESGRETHTGDLIDVFKIVYDLFVKCNESDRRGHCKKLSSKDEAGSIAESVYLVPDYKWTSLSESCAKCTTMNNCRSHIQSELKPETE